jgi:hypothetical protein
LGPTRGRDGARPFYVGRDHTQTVWGRFPC